MFSENMFGNGVSSRSSEAELIEMVFHQETGWDIFVWTQGGCERERTSRELDMFQKLIGFHPVNPDALLAKTTRDRGIKENSFG